MNKLLLTATFVLASGTCFAQKKQDMQHDGRQPKDLIPKPATLPIAILSTDPIAKEDKLDNSWTFTNARILLHGSDTLTCEVMVCRQDVWLFKSNVRITSPDGLVVRANELAISALPKK